MRCLRHVAKDQKGDDSHRDRVPLDVRMEQSSVTQEFGSAIDESNETGEQERGVRGKDEPFKMAKLAIVGMVFSRRPSRLDIAGWGRSSTRKPRRLAAKQNLNLPD
jgi:hypothetical protein